MRLPGFNLNFSFKIQVPLKGNPLKGVFKNAFKHLRKRLAEILYINNKIPL